MGGGGRLKPQKYVLGSGYAHSDSEPVINLLYSKEMEILGSTVQYGCCGGYFFYCENVDFNEK